MVFSRICSTSECLAWIRLSSKFLFFGWVGIKPRALTLSHIPGPFVFFFKQGVTKLLNQTELEFMSLLPQPPRALGSHMQWPLLEGPVWWGSMTRCSLLDRVTGQARGEEGPLLPGVAGPSPLPGLPWDCPSLLLRTTACCPFSRDRAGQWV